MKRLILLTAVLALGACSLLQREQPEPTLSALQPVRLPAPEGEVPRASLAEIESVYRGVLDISPDPRTRLQVLHRLADIEMLQAESELANADSPDPLFDDAIDAYRSLLLEQPDHPANDRLLYQLSKAHDFSGDNEASLEVLRQLSTRYPASEYYVEAEFRIAESHFSEGDYRAAEFAYARVLERGDATTYYTNALYMHGWSQFKQGHYRASITAFTRTLDLLLGDGYEVEALEPARRELALDSFRVLAVVFSYLEGADTIASAYGELGYRSYLPQLYQHLGELYLRQERFRDSAETYRAFIVAYPDSRHAHAFQVEVIEIYEQGGFPDLIVAEKRNYVEAYGVTGAYWAMAEPEVRSSIRANLEVFIEELATHYHALAQAQDAQENADPAATAELYATAGRYYELFISSFVDDPRVPDMGFLLGEARFESGNLAEAITAWEWVAYDYPDFSRAADAGYAAVLAYGELLGQVPAQEQQALRRARVDSQLSFSAVFPTDDRSPPVLNDAAATLLELGEYELAIAAASTLTQWQPVPGLEILVPAWLVIGHSYFETGEWSAAEAGYQQALGRMTEADQRVVPVRERLAASIYRQGEEAAQLGEFALAAEQFVRVIELTPEAAIRVQAQYDAAANYMAAGDYLAANELLLDFRLRFPGHELAQGIGAKLVLNYEQLEQWELAAAELDTLLQAEPDAERKRQLLYLAAEYYDKAGNTDIALLRYRSYAHGWAEPVAVRLEAMSRLAELYELRREGDKQRFWLRKIILAHDTAGDQRSERSLFLAARASSVLADDEFQAYRGIALRHPIAASLKKKKSAMQKTLAAYGRTNDYGVAEFSTLATYRMGEVYRVLSVDLLESERPAKLDALALEQYELLLEEQAYPFEEKAIAIHESNARRSWEGLYDEWVQQSFAALAALSPVRYAKSETRIAYSRDIF